MADSTGSFPAGSWRPGHGARPADTGYKGPAASGAHATWQATFAGELRPRGNSQSADPVIKDKASRKNVRANPSERNGPAGVVSCGRAYSNVTHTDTGRSVRIMPSVHSNGDAMRNRGGC